jgi:hypothetical protein
VERDPRLEELETRLLNVGLASERARWREPVMSPPASDSGAATGGGSTAIGSALEELWGKLADLAPSTAATRPARSSPGLALDELQTKLEGLGIVRR